MFDIKTGWLTRLEGAKSPATTEKAGWQISHDADSAFVEPSLKILEGDPRTAPIIVVAAPGAVGKSTYARALAQQASGIVVDLARTEPLGGNFFVGGLANAFGYKALTDATEGRLALIVDALDEAQLRSGVEGYAAGLLDLGKIAQQPHALPSTLFGRAAAATEAWLIFSDAGLNPCLLEIEFFNDDKCVQYIERKLRVIADKRPRAKAAFEKHEDRFKELALRTREKLTAIPGGEDMRFAGYAPVLDAICEFAIDEDALNPQARAIALTAQSAVELVDEIAGSILDREQKKLLEQLKAEHPTAASLNLSEVYSPSEQLSRIASSLIGAKAPNLPHTLFALPSLHDTYERMVAEFAPQHPFLDGRGNPSNAAFAAYLLVWCITSGKAVAEARKALNSNPGLVSGLFFELYMLWLTRDITADEPKRMLSLTDVGALYASFVSQASQGELPTLEISGEPEDEFVDVEFEMVHRETNASADEGSSSFGPFEVVPDSVLELRGALSGVYVSAGIAMIIGDGMAVNVTAPVEIDVDTLEIDGRELRVFKSAARSEIDTQQVDFAASDASVERVERIVVHGANLTVSFPGSRIHPWSDYSIAPSAAPNEAIEELRRRLRRVLTSFRSHSKGSLVRLAAKIDHARMMKKGSLGPRLVAQLKADGIITEFDAGKFYTLHPDKMARAIGMDYQALHKQNWSEESNKYLANIR